MRLDPDSFFEMMTPAIAICRQYGVHGSVCAAQAAIESTWNEDTIESSDEDVATGRATGIGGYNLFGRKAVSSDPLQKWEWTTEYGGADAYPQDEDHIYVEEGRWRVKAWFKLYPSLEDAITDYCVLLTEEACYAPVMEKKGDLIRYVYALAGDGTNQGVYATDAKYGPRILVTIRANDLGRFE